MRGCSSRTPLRNPHCSVHQDSTHGGSHAFQSCELCMQKCHLRVQRFFSITCPTHSLSPSYPLQPARPTSQTEAAVCTQSVHLPQVSVCLCVCVPARSPATCRSVPASRRAARSQEPWRDGRKPRAFSAAALRRHREPPGPCPPPPSRSRPRSRSRSRSRPRRGPAARPAPAPGPPRPHPARPGARWRLRGARPTVAPQRSRPAANRPSAAFAPPPRAGSPQIELKEP